MSTSTSTPAQPTTEINLQGAQATISKARQLPLHVAAFKDAFPEATQDIARIAENSNPENPDLIKGEVGAIKQYAAKLKFQYQEKASKVKFTKHALAEAAPEITPEMQDEHAGEAKRSKDGLATAKVELKDLIETLRPMFGGWQKEYQSLTTKSDRLEYLSKCLASLQLEFDLLRAKYPHPRRTIDELEEHAQEQVEAIIALTEKKEQRAAELAQKRKELEEAQKRVERLQGKVVDVERKAEGVAKRKDGGESAAKAEWLRQYSKYAMTHLPIRSLDRVSENELRMEISLPSGEYTTLSVVFHPVTGKLAKAELVDSPMQLDDELISGYVQKDDFAQLIHAVWKRLSIEG